MARVGKIARAGFIVVTVLIVGVLCIRAYNTRRFHLEEQTRFMMDTYVTIYAIGPKEQASRAVDLALNRMQDIDEKFSALNADSPIYAFNHAGIPITDEEVLQVVGHAIETGKATGGAFDITVASLLDLWGFYGDSPRLPDPQEIEGMLAFTGHQHLLLRNGRLEKAMPEIRIDLGGIAKGYSAQQASKVLLEAGISSALIDAGGDVYALGKKGRKYWRVGLRGPKEEELLGFLEVEDLAVMGSGDYERFFMANGVRYHHIIDPRTGYPAQGLSGATLIHPDPVIADAWCTALFVLGPERGLELIEHHPGMEAVLVKASGEKVVSSGLQDTVKEIL